MDTSQWMTDNAVLAIWATAGFTFLGSFINAMIARSTNKISRDAKEKIDTRLAEYGQQIEFNKELARKRLQAYRDVIEVVCMVFGGQYNEEGKVKVFARDKDYFQHVIAKGNGLLKHLSLLDKDTGNAFFDFLELFGEVERWPDPELFNKIQAQATKTHRLAGEHMIEAHNIPQLRETIERVNKSNLLVETKQDLLE